MSEAFVVDCSMTMAWCFSDEASPESSAVLDRLAAETAVVPLHWLLEVANVLALAERKKRIDPRRSTDFLHQLGRLDIEIDDAMPGRVFSHVLPICRDQGLTSYDAAYLELCLRRRLPLATLDSELMKAADRIGVKRI